MRRRTTRVTLKAGELALALKAFRALQGDRPILLAYKLGQIKEPIITLHRALVERLRPYVAGSVVRTDLTDEEKAEVEAIIHEELTFQVPRLTLAEVQAAPHLRVTDDNAAVFLIEKGLIAK